MAKTPQMREIEDNWRQTKPELYASLKASGKLTSALQDESTRMTGEIDALVASGLRLDEATEIVRPEYLTPPSSRPAEPKPHWKMPDHLKEWADRYDATPTPKASKPT